MDCQELNSQLYDYCDDSVSPQMYLKISKHLKDCANCQNVYQLTRLENEVLRDTSDIPALSADFTSRVIGSISSSPRRPAMLYNRKLWYGSLMAVAVFALFLYAPQILKHQPAVELADNAGTRSSDTVAPTVISTPGNILETKQATEYNDRPSLSPLTGKDSPANVPSNNTVAEPLASPPSNITPLPVPDTGSAPPEPAATQMLAAPEIRRTPSPSVSGENTPPQELAARDASPTIAVEDYEPVISPVNVPPNLMLNQVDISDGDRTVYDYSSADGQTQIQITVDPYIAPEVKMQTLDQSNSPSSNSMARWVVVGNKMMTVTYSGNVPIEELTQLANTIRFE